MKKTLVPIKDTTYFSSLMNDYVREEKSVEEFIQFFPKKENIEAQIARKKNQFVNRKVLLEVVNAQYKELTISDLTKNNIESLLSENTFTICTAHQPNVMTGYLYFIYKIMHAIKLSRECADLYPAYNFVPVYYIGSEDNDLDEIGTFHINNKTLMWNTSQTGACGRMVTIDMEQLMQEVLATLNDQLPDEKHLINVLKNAYNGRNTLSDATRILVNDLFGKYGLVIIDADHHLFKKEFIPVMKDELLQQSSFDVVTNTLAKLSENYKVQASPRELNLFYLKGNIRERIIMENDVWNVVNTTIVFSESELLEELEKYPEHFSPNVILRPLYQETILPNIAFIGGGGEMAYWMQLKALFEYHKVVYPMLFLRNSMLWVNAKSAQKIASLGLDFNSIFLHKDILIKQLLSEDDAIKKLALLQKNIDEQLQEIENLSGEVSLSLQKSMQAHHAKMHKIQQRIHQKFLANLKRKNETTWHKLEDVKDFLFPNNSLQERYHNFFTIYKSVGPNMLDILLENQEGFGREFIILSEA